MLEKIGQLLFIGLEGPELLESEAEFIVRNDIGGVILFARNVESPRQVFELTSQVQKLSKKTKSQAPLFIGVDQEGGRVARLKKEFTSWPPLASLGKIGSTSLAFKYAQSMGEELLGVGINLNFAPCVDILTNDQNSVIGDRSLHSDPEEVAKLASALVRGYIKSNIIPCAKHFPGHGNTKVDSHEDLPKEITPIETLNERELIPFRKVFRSRLELVMTSHILFENIDPEWPATLSEIFLQKILKEDCRYRGLVISDDLDMKALTKNFATEEIPVRALIAGCDLLLYCNEFDKPPQAISSIQKALKANTLSGQRIDESFQKIMALKKKTLSSLPRLSWEESQSQLFKVNEHQALADAVASGKVPAEWVQS